MAAERKDGNSLEAKELIKGRIKEHQSVGALAPLRGLGLKWQQLGLSFQGVLQPVSSSQFKKDRDLLQRAQQRC